MVENGKSERLGGGSAGNLSGDGGPGAAGEGSADVPGGGQGDDLADALGRREGGGAGSRAAAESGDSSAGRTEDEDDDAPAVAAGSAPDAGSPGGMGGVRGGAPNPDHRPDGGVSPIRSSGDNDRH